MNPTLIAYGLLALLIYSGGIGTLAYLRGKHQCHLEQVSTEKTHIETVLNEREKNEHDSNQDAASTIAKTEAVRTETRTVVRQVPVYITPVADRRCVVGADFVRLHNLSASGAGREDDSDPTREPDDAPSGIALSAVAETVIDNYGTCRSEMIRFEGLQEWVSNYCKSGE